MINVYKINDDKFKGVYLSLNFMMNSNKKIISENSVLSSILSKSTNKYKTQEEIEKYLASLYGANFNVNVEKYGDIENVEFKIQCINENIINEKEKIVNKCIQFLYDIVFDNNISNGILDDDLFNREKNFILEKISARKDEKLKYGVNRTEEIIAKDTGFGTFIFGDENEVKSLTKKDIIAAYNNLINNSCITFLASGNLMDYDNIEQDVKEIFNDKFNLGLDIDNLCYNNNNLVNKNEEIIEKCESTQSVITAGFIVENISEEDTYALNVYNAILGSTPSSKLFQIFREKESLAYTARSRYYRFKNIIIIYAGIQKDNYNKSKDVILNILKQIEDGNITEDEFSAAKQSLVADLKEWQDSKILMAKFLLTDFIVYKNPKRTIEEMQQKIMEVSIQDVINISKKVKLKLWYLLGGEISE